MECMAKAANMVPGLRSADSILNLPLDGVDITFGGPIVLHGQGNSGAMISFGYPKFSTAFSWSKKLWTPTLVICIAWRPSRRRTI